MLILVSTCFLLLNAPSHICTISLKLYTSEKSHVISNSLPTYFNTSNETLSIVHDDLTFVYETTTAMHIANRSKVNIKLFQIFYIIVIITLHISYLSYSINFFLYSFCGMKFRRELTRFFSRCREDQGQSHGSRMVSAQNSF